MIDVMVDVVCKATAPQSKTVAACLDTEDSPYLKTGLEQLDLALKGGLPTGGIVEIVGPAGAGKTQFCLQSCVLAMGGWSGLGTVYIDTASSSVLAETLWIFSHSNSRLTCLTSRNQDSMPSGFARSRNMLCRKLFRSTTKQKSKRSQTSALFTGFAPRNFSVLRRTKSLRALLPHHQR